MKNLGLFKKVVLVLILTVGLGVFANSNFIPFNWLKSKLIQLAKLRKESINNPKLLANYFKVFGEVSSRVAVAIDNGNEKVIELLEKIARKNSGNKALVFEVENLLDDILQTVKFWTIQAKNYNSEKVNYYKRVFRKVKEAKGTVRYILNK